MVAIRSKWNLLPGIENQVIILSGKLFLLRLTTNQCS